MPSATLDTMDVISDISPNDEMFFGNETHYFGVGRSAMTCIDLALRAAKKPAADIWRILDLPCGHGRVLRHLKSAFPARQNYRVRPES